MTELTLYDVSADDQVELLDKLGVDGVKFTTPPAGGTRSGEPVTIAVIVLSAVAINGLVAYWLKGRKKGKVKIRHATFTTSTGSIELKDVELEFSEEQEASAQMVNALHGWLKTAIPASLGH